jgi:hypothetical protein
MESFEVEERGREDSCGGWVSKESSRYLGSLAVLQGVLQSSRKSCSSPRSLAVLKRL